MKKHWLLIAGIAVAGLAAGLYARGLSDSKGWTTGTP
jgi:hypothetical protein